MNGRNKKIKKLTEYMGGSCPASSESYQGNFRHTIISPYLTSSDVNKYHCQVFEHLNAEFISINLTCLKERLSKLNRISQKKVFISF